MGESHAQTRIAIKRKYEALLMYPQQNFVHQGRITSIHTRQQKKGGLFTRRCHSGAWVGDAHVPKTRLRPWGYHSPRARGRSIPLASTSHRPGQSHGACIYAPTRLALSHFQRVLQGKRVPCRTRSSPCREVLGAKHLSHRLPRPVPLLGSVQQ